MRSFRVYLRILAFMKPYPKDLVAVFILMLVAAAFNGISILMILPFLSVLFAGGAFEASSSSGGGKGFFNLTPDTVGSVLDKMEQKVLAFYAADSPVETLGRICISILLLYLLKGLFTYLLSVRSAGIEQEVIRDIRNRLYAHLHKLSLAFFHASRTGQIISRITADVGLVLSSLKSLSAIRSAPPRGRHSSSWPQSP